MEILDAGFVRFEGERIPREAFLYEMRRRVREAREDRERRPSVRVFMDASGDAPADPYALDSLLLELERSGVKSVTLG